MDMKEALTLLKSTTPLVFAKNRAMVIMTGTDARSFLQRMTTNNIYTLAKDNPIQTCFINNKGRMFDHCLLFEVDNNDFIIVSSHQDDRLFNWIEQFHFAEDFLHKKVGNEYYFKYEISITKSNQELSIKCWSTQLTEGGELNFFGTLKTSPDNSSYNEDLFETMRIQALMPQSPLEINDSFMPHNINLGDFIADNKGCYIGQEVIAKALLYQKNVKSLCGAKLSESSFISIKPGHTIKSPEGHMGEVLSIAPIYWNNEVNALISTDLNRQFTDKNNAHAVAVGSFITKKQ